jgi:type II secretory pathway pseudopilin PulG
MNVSAQRSKGFSLVEVIVVAAISTLIFGTMFASFQFSLELLNNSRAKLSALSLANDRLEFIRSLSYNDVGTLGGIPAGTIPQNSTTTLNGIVFSERVLIEYVDDPGDGQDTATTSDSNGIPSDYKRVKVEYTWTMASSTDRISMITNIVPRSIETTAGGGTIRVSVVDEAFTFLPGASVRLVNNSITPNIDITRLSNAQGVALFSGAPAGSNYEVFVTRAGYSTDQTYQATTSNPLPVLAPFSVLESDVSAVTFRIDELSDLDVFAYDDISEGSVEERFTDSTGIVSNTDTAIVGGRLELLNTAGLYAPSGIAYLTPVTPATLARWETVRVASELPAGTSFVVRFYTDDGVGNYTLIPDSELAGNGVGFTDTLIDISRLVSVTYPQIVVGITLTTTNSSATPRIDELEIFYRETESALGGATVSLRGNKLIGTEVDLTPIYKYSSSLLTNGSGRAEFVGIEFDAYIINVSGSYSIATACPTNPYIVAAGQSDEAYFLVAPAVTQSLRVTAIDPLGRPIPGAEVTLERPGFTRTQTTNTCGQTFFSGLASESDYQVQLSLQPYNSITQTAITIAGNSEVLVNMTQ